MTLRDLQYLLAVEQTRHFHKAAEQCFVSQPTLSGQIKKLEQELGVQLIERTNRRVNMTEVGMQVVKQARQVFSDVDVIKNIVQSYQDPLEGDMRVGLIPTIAPYLLPVIMPTLNKTFPKLKLWLYEYQTHILLEKLEQGNLDMLILALPVEKHSFNELELFREPFRLAVGRGTKLAKRKHINLGDIAKDEILVLEEGHCLRGHVLDICHLSGARKASPFQATSLETLRHMIGEGVGMTLIPELAVPEKTRQKDPVQYIEFSDPKPNRRIGMLFRKNSYREIVFEKMAEQIRSALPVSIFF